MKKTLAALMLLVLMLVPLNSFAISAEDFVVSDDVDDTDKYYFYARLLMADMSLEEKVAQLFIVRPEDLSANAEYMMVNDEMASVLAQCPVGGVMIQGANINSAEQLRSMNAAMQEAASENGTPLFIAAEEEGGAVERIALKLGLEKTPSLHEIAETGFEENAYEQGFILAQRLKHYGFNLNFAPVADLRPNDELSIPNRYAGINAENTAMITVQIAAGMQQQGVQPVMKYFPGANGANESIDTLYEELIQKNCLPYKQAIQNGLGMIMVSALPVSSVEAGVPAMFSGAVCEQLLRQTLRFEGVIITSAMGDNTNERIVGSGEQCIQALLAGCDMLLLPENYAEAHKQIISAIEGGILSEERVEQSVIRILALKIINGLID